MNDTLDRLTKLAGQRNARLESLREACRPLAGLIVRLPRPNGSRYDVYLHRQSTNAGECEWTIVAEGRYNCDDRASEPWTLDRACGENGGYTHGDFNSPKPTGPTPRQLRDFAAWLADPATLQAYADTEQRTAEAVDNTTARLNAAAEALTKTKGE